MPRIDCVITIQDRDEALKLSSADGPEVHGLLHQLVRAGHAGDKLPPTCRLSGRQWDVLRGLSEGLSNKAIADELGISHHTVRQYIAQLFAALGVTSRHAAVMAVSPVKIGHVPLAGRSIAVEVKAVPRGLRRAGGHV